MINLMIIYDVLNIFSMRTCKSSRKLRVGLNWYPGVNWSTTTRVLQAGMCSQSGTPDNIELCDNGYISSIIYGIPNNEIHNRLHGKDKSNSGVIANNIIQNECDNCCNTYGNIGLNVEALCFMKGPYEKYNYNIFAPVFVHNVNANRHRGLGIC